MTTFSERVKRTLSVAKESLLYKTPLGNDTLFGDSKVQSENGDINNIHAYSSFMNEYPRFSERNGLSHNESPGYGSLPYDFLRGSPLTDERDERFANYFSHSRFSVRGSETASTATSRDFTATSLPSSLSQNSRGPISNSSLQTCDICAEERQPSEFPTIPITPTCTHPVTDACKECVRRHLATQLSSRGTAALHCICNQPLSLDDVQRNANPEDFARYSERATMELLESDSQFIWCPAQGCGAGQIQQRGSDEPKVTCARCQQPYCFIHRVRWHSGMTCRQYDQAPELADAARASENAQNLAHASRHQEETRERDNERRRALEVAAREQRKREAQERDDESFVRRNARPCPNCKYMTQKDKGCKHVTCKLKIYSSDQIASAKCCNQILGVKCRFEFCWECKRAWMTGHLSTSCW